MKRKIVKKKVKLFFPNAKDFLRALLISSIVYFTLFAIGYIFNNTIAPLMIITTLTTIFIYGIHDTDIRKRTILIRIIVSFSSPIILFIIGGFVYGNFRDGFKILLSSKDNFVSYSIIFGALYYSILIQLFQKTKLIEMKGSQHDPRKNMDNR